LDIKVNVRESEGDAYVVDLTGEIDVYTSPKVKDAITELIDQEHYNLVINLEKVRYIDSTGLGVLIGGLKRVREHGGSVNLVCTNPQIKKIFDITLAIAEACTNSIHAAGGVDAGTIEIVCDAAEDELRVTVRDSSTGPHLEPAEPGGLVEGRTEALGVFLIRALMDTVEYTTDPRRGTELVMTKRVTP
jgi:anti-sigma B factor antagonist